MDDTNLWDLPPGAAAPARAPKDNIANLTSPHAGHQALSWARVLAQTKCVDKARAVLLDALPEVAGEDPAVGKILRDLLGTDPSYEAIEEAIGLLFRFGWNYQESVRTQRPLGAQGEPLPMWTYPATEYLLRLDMSNARVLEIGAGYSTLFLQERVKSLLSYENNEKWATELTTLINEKVDLRLHSKAQWNDALNQIEGEFDIIAIDCAANRYEAVLAVRSQLATGGMILLDNTEWYPNTTELLRNSGLHQVDFCGLRPAHINTSITSIFFASDFRIPRGDGPRYPVGGNTK